MDRFTAAHGKIHLMLLGSPPDMVHGIPSHRTRPFAHADTLRFRFTSILTKPQRKIIISKSDSSLNALANIIYYFLVFYKCYVKFFETDIKRVEEHRKFWYNIMD